MRIRIGKKQRDMLTRLDLVGPCWLDELSWNDQRSVKSLERQDKVRLVPAVPGGPLRVYAVEPDHD